MKKILLVLCVYFLTVFPSYAKSIIHLKDGYKVEGDIIERDNDYVKINLEGIELTYWSDQIEKIEGEEGITHATSADAQKTTVKTSKKTAIDRPQTSLPPSPQPPLEEAAKSAVSQEFLPEESVAITKGQPVKSAPAVSAKEEPLVKSLPPKVSDSRQAPSPAVSYQKASLDTSEQLSASVPKMTPEQARAALAAIILITMAISLLAYLFFAFCLQLIAKKTSTAHAWLAWIPIANLYLMCRVANKPLWWLLCLFIPFLNIIFMILLWMGIAEARDKPGWVGLLMLVPGINIFIPVYLAFSK